MTHRGRVLIVDDNQASVDLLRQHLGKEYEVEAAASADECRAKMAAFKPQLLVLSAMMHGVDGYDLCRQIKCGAAGDTVQLILVSEREATGDRVRACQARADDYLVTPFERDDLMSRVRVQFRLWDAQRQVMIARDQLEICARELEETVSQRTRQLTATQDMAVFALARVADSRDPETGEHLHRIRYYAQTIAEELGNGGLYAEQIDKQFLQDLYRSSPLHDIGKVAVPDSILQKPERLTPDEFSKMKQHVIVGAQTLEMARDQVGPGTFMDMAAQIARYHHEKFDGNGYCAGLSGQDIPLAARIVALADVYDALTSRRVYKSPYDPEVARDIIIRESGSHFDPAIVNAFLTRFEAFRNAVECPESLGSFEPVACEDALAVSPA
ncbi:MAG: HD domain-containing phosphohydrolase [Thermoguttaceae bacterium]